MKKVGLVLLILMMGSVMLFASGAQQKAAEPSETTLRWAYWGSGVRIEISQAAIDLFQSKNPGIKVNPEVSGGAGDHFNKVDTQIAGGSGPDIIQMGGNIGDYVKKGVLLPLDAYAGNVLNISVIDQGAIDSGTVDGKLYGVSTGVNMPALVYNKAMLQRVGAPLPKASMTFDEFRAYLMSIKGKLPAGVYPMQDIGATSSNSVVFGYLLRYNGTPLYDDKTNSTGLTPEVGKKFLDLFKDYRDNGLVPPADIAAGYAETNADTSMVIAGKALIGFLWTNQLGGYQAATKDELDFIELPGAASSKALWQQPSQFFTVNKDSKNADLTVKFINFLVNDPEAARILGSNRGTPASSTARAAGSNDPGDQKILDYLKTAGPHSMAETPHLPNDTELNSTLFLLYQKVAFGQVNTAEGGKQIYDMVVRLINK